MNRTRFSSQTGMLPVKDPPTGALPSVVASSTAELLLEVHDGGRRHVYRMVHDSLRVGRAPDSDIVLQESSVSRLHCIFQRQGDELIILDNKTHNGTLLNGKKIEDYSSLKSGDVVQVGKTRIVFRRFVRKNIPRGPVTRDTSNSFPQVPLTEKVSENFSSQIVSVPKATIPRRFYVYAIVALLIAVMAYQSKTSDQPKLGSDEIIADPIAAYQKAVNEKDGTLRKAAREIVESSTAIVLKLEADLLKQEKQLKFDELTKKKYFGAPSLTYKQKLTREHFFSGVREYNYQNYSRAEEHFKHALIQEPELATAQDYLLSATNRRRLLALEEYKLGTRYFEGKRFASSIAKFKAVQDLLNKDQVAESDPMWKEILKNAEEYVRMADLASGKHNIYQKGTQ